MAKGITEPAYMSRSEMIHKISLPGQSREELEQLTKYIHEVEETSEERCSTSQSVNTVKNANCTSEIDLEDELYNTSLTSESSCSCESCMSSYTSCSCSCSDHHEDTEEELSSLTTSTSNNTVIDQEGRDKGNKFSNIYVVNGSNVSEQFDDNDPIPKNLKQKQKQLRQELQAPPVGINRYSTTPEQELYEPVNLSEIRRQKNARALKKYLREFAADWDTRVNNLNTLRRGKVLKELKKQLRDTIDLDNVKPEELGKQVEVALREALDSSYEAISNVNIGHMYVPMEENPSNSKAVSRENTDYDTFGSIDSLIFEPKIPTNEAIQEAQEEIENQFDFLKVTVEEPNNNEEIIGPGKTTFAERVKLFQQLGDAKKPPPATATNWKKVALEKKQQKQDEQHSLCPECHNPMLESFICSTCDGCSTNYGEIEEKESSAASQKVTVAADIHQISSGTASWDYLDHDPVPQPKNNENNLRRLLKENFGAANLYEPVVYSASDMEHNVEYEVDFLSEYAQKRSFDSKITPQLLDKSGSKISVTEDIFRADIEGTLKGLDKKRKTSTSPANASDSGIASPPPGGEVSLLRAPSTIPNETINEELEDERADSGMMEEKPKNGKNVPKRDTMIRELKSRLKAKFQVEEIMVPEMIETSQIKTGTVESRKLAMESQLSRCFAAKKLPPLPPSNPAAAPVFRKPMTNFADINKKRQNSGDRNCSDCGGEQITQNRETLYGPGGLFGPKGPFSTPHVRYPNGMELPPRRKTPLRTKTPNLYSEISSIAEDRSVKSQYIMNSVLSYEAERSKPPSRMETYLADWSELPKEDIDKWKEEKSKRMLAWIHTLHGNDHIGTETPWWKVKIKAKICLRL